MKVIDRFEFDGEQMVLKSGEYDSGGSIALRVETADGEPYATITANFPEHFFMLGKDEFFVKSWAENEPITAFLFHTGKLVKTGKRLQHGFVTVPVCKLNV